MLAAARDFAVKPPKAGERKRGPEMLYHAHRLTLVASLLFGAAATAQVTPTQIAYVKAGGRPEVHLVKSDGSDHRIVYVAPRGTEIYHVDLNPNGGELAIEEHALVKGRATIASKIKVINYNSEGVSSVRSMQLTCLTGSLDYHPNNSTLLYRDCSTSKRIKRLDTTAMPAESTTDVGTDLGLSHDAFIASWLDATNLLYWASGTFYTVSTGALASPTSRLYYPFPGALDTSTSGNTGLWSDGGMIRLVDITAGTIAPFENPGQRGHFSPDSSNVIYVTGNEVGQKNQFVRIRSTADANAPRTTVAGKGSFTALDWGE